MPQFRVVAVEYLGLSRTDPDWIESYLDLQLPETMDGIRARVLANRLMTTGAFTDVKAVIEAFPSRPGESVLKFEIDEKWTTIPILRGAYGGGTPLRVIGFYDIHSFGRLVTLGAESRKYGDAPPGYVAYMKVPRHNAGRTSLGLELWRDFRRRTFFSEDGKELGATSSADTIVRVRALQDLGRVFTDADVTDTPWKAGMQAEVAYEAPAVFKASFGAPVDAEVRVQLPTAGVTTARQFSLLPMLQYDDVVSNQLTSDGLRVLARNGPVFREGRTYSKSELETFWFAVLPGEVNFALHALAGTTTYDSLYNRYFLGGFDSIRGYPDGILHGTRAAFANAELRYTTLRYRYAHVQNLAFLDAGGAGNDWDVVKSSQRASGGLGIRLSVPQIYRMVFRFDYAWALDGSGKRGLAAGVNQYFDPYKPL